MADEQEGLCVCGCGRRTTIPLKSNRKYGRIRGVPVRFIHGHNGRGAMNTKWKGGRCRHQYGKYILIWRPGHPRADKHGYVREHWLIAEAAMGKVVPRHAVIHHVDRANPRNLVVCENQTYHLLIEYRTKAYLASGHANYRLCVFCKKWDDPANLYTSPAGRRSGLSSRHRSCANRYHQQRKNKRRLVNGG